MSIHGNSSASRSVLENTRCRPGIYIPILQIKLLALRIQGVDHIEFVKGIHSHFADRTSVLENRSIRNFRDPCTSLFCSSNVHSWKYECTQVDFEFIALGLHHHSPDQAFTLENVRYAPGGRMGIWKDLRLILISWLVGDLLILLVLVWRMVAARVGYWYWCI